jgi:hypothetical protein
MANRIAAMVAGGREIGTIEAFSVPEGLTKGAPMANLNGLSVGLRWRYGDISAVVFRDAAEAARWPGFHPAQDAP